MVENISENHHNVYTRQNTSNGNSTFCIKTNYSKLFPLEKNTLVVLRRDVLLNRLMATKPWVEKVIKTKGDKLYFKWKGYNNSLYSLINKKDLV